MNTHTQDGNFALMQNDNYNELMRLGLQLSNEISCGVRYPAYEKNAFECSCGILFPVYVVKSGDWEQIKRLHNKEV